MIGQDQAVTEGICSPSLLKHCPLPTGQSRGAPAPSPSPSSQRCRPAEHCHCDATHIQTGIRRHSPTAAHAPTSASSHGSAPACLWTVPRPGGANPCLPPSLGLDENWGLSPVQVGKQAPQERSFVQGHVGNKNAVGSSGSCYSQQEALRAGGGKQLLTPLANLPAALL